MTENFKCFTQLENPKVVITGIRDIKAYLLTHVTEFSGQPTVKFTTEGAEVIVHCANFERGKLQRHFFGYIEDIALNIQNGFYEEAKDES